MIFKDKREFTNWFIPKIKNATKEWGNQNACESAARAICKRYISNTIEIHPVTTTWRGIDVFADCFWECNHLLLTGKYDDTSLAADNYSTQSYNSTSYSQYSAPCTTTQTDNGIVKRHNFDNSLRKIQEFSNNVPYIPSIDKFQTDGGLFGWGDHYINGNEMNRYVEKVQDMFRAHNNAIIRTVKEFREIYATFNYLDKEYITGIVQSVEAAKKAGEGAGEASRQAKAASDQAKSAADKALKNEEDLRQDVQNLHKLVEKIKLMKEDLSNRISALEGAGEASRQAKAASDQAKAESDQAKSAAYKALKKVLDLQQDVQNLHKLVEKINLMNEDLSNRISALESSLKRIQDGEKSGPAQDDLSKRISALESSLESIKRGSLDEKKLKWDVIMAYVVGGAGLVLSVCSLVL